MIIPGFEAREMWMSIAVILIAMVFSLANYRYHCLKNETKPKFHLQVTYAALGFCAGVVLAITTSGGDGIGHWTMAGFAVIAGIGAQDIFAKIKTSSKHGLILNLRK